LSEVNRSASLEIEDATLPNVVLDINELCGIVDSGSAFGGITRGNSENTP
jgi:hypothetical protein